MRVVAVFVVVAVIVVVVVVVIGGLVCDPKNHGKEIKSASKLGGATPVEEVLGSILVCGST